MNPTKKQKILLDFIDGFVKGRGYSPTLREIMQALGYKSVSTVAKHVDNLIVRGWLVKRDGEARSLEVVTESAFESAQEDHRDWFLAEIQKRQKSPDRHEEAVVLQRAAEILGFVDKLT